MDKTAYQNSVVRQVMDLDVLADIQTGLCFDLEKLKKVLPWEAAGKIKRVIVTGCGDSYSAVGAMLPGFRILSGVKKCNSPDIMDFCRFYTESKIKKGFDKEEVLVAAISFSGSAKRVGEALDKAGSLGIPSLLITRNPDSIGGRAARYVFNVETPDGCNSPGLRSYYASLVGVAALGAYIGLCNGTITEKRFLEVKQSIAAYTKNFMQDFVRIDDLMFSEALRMKDLTKFEVIADGNTGYCAQFVEQKFIECGGVYCDHTNSEEFAHISLFFRGPGEFGTIVMIQEADKSLSRMRDTVYGCLTQKRPTLIVTDAPAEIFAAEENRVSEIPDMYNIANVGKDAAATAGKAVICRIATAPEAWMTPFVDFIPGSLLAGYQAAVNEKKYFDGRYDFRTETWVLG